MDGDEGEPYVVGCRGTGGQQLHPSHTDLADHSGIVGQEDLDLELRSFLRLFIGIDAHPAQARVECPASASKETRAQLREIHGRLQTRILGGSGAVPLHIQHTPVPRNRVVTRATDSQRCEKSQPPRLKNEPPEKYTGPLSTPAHGVSSLLMKRRRSVDR